MKYQVISAFIDKRTGRQIEPGEAVPEGLSEETLERLVEAQCLKLLKTADTSSDLFGEGKSTDGGDDTDAGEGAGEGEGDAGGNADGADSATNGKAVGGRKSKAKK